MSKSEDEECKDLLQKIASIAGLINSYKHGNKIAASSKWQSSTSYLKKQPFYSNQIYVPKKRNLSLVTPYGQTSSATNTNNTANTTPYIPILKLNKPQTHLKSPVSKFSHFPHRKSISKSSPSKLDIKYTKPKFNQTDIRMRLVKQSKNLIAKAKKKTKYCIFFNKFGKCDNKDKCPFIHDPSKVAVCRKFLKGECHNDSCLRLHKVSAERMPVCSYFLRGVCTKENCPYSHVRVNPKAQVCPDFVNGYCPIGENCKMKHIEVCPHFFNQGICQNRDDCKLVHIMRQANEEKKKDFVQQSSNEEWIDLNADEDSRQVISPRSFASSTAK